MSTVLAVDPGGTSGLAVWSDGALRATGQYSFRDLFDYVKNLSGVDHVVVERFTLNHSTVRMSAQPTALEAIGYLRTFAWSVGSSFTLQSPADAKRFATDERLTAAHWKLPSKLDHANDALRHLLLFLVKSGEMEPPR